MEGRYYLTFIIAWCKYLIKNYKPRRNKVSFGLDGTLTIRDNLFQIPGETFSFRKNVVPGKFKKARKKIEKLRFQAHFTKIGLLIFELLTVNHIPHPKAFLYNI